MRITITVETDQPNAYDFLSVDMSELVAYVGTENARRHTRVRLTESVHSTMPTLREFVGEVDTP